MFYSDVKKSTTLSDDLVRLDNGATVQDDQCMVRDAYRKAQNSAQWIELNSLAKYMFRTTRDGPSGALRIRVRMRFGYEFLYPLTISKPLRRTTEESTTSNVEVEAPGSSSERRILDGGEGSVNAENYISSDFIYDYSITVGCANNQTYRLELTIVPKVKRKRVFISSRLCKPNDPDLAGIENYMPKLSDVSLCSIVLAGRSSNNLRKSFQKPVIKSSYLFRHRFIFLE